MRLMGRLAGVILIALCVGFEGAASQETPPLPGGAPIQFDGAGHSERIAVYTFLLSIFTALLFAATAVLAFFTIILALTTIRNGRRQLRAYVSVMNANVKIINLIEGGKGIEFNIELKNSGQTPCYQFTTWAYDPVIDTPEAIPFTSPTPVDQRGGHTILGPGESAHLRRTVRVSEGDIDEVEAARKRIYAWGGCDFTDVFKKERFLRFRSMNGHPAYTDNFLLGWSVQAHKLGYDAN